jgi:hypothetical protein
MSLPFLSLLLWNQLALAVASLEAVVVPEAVVSGSLTQLLVISFVEESLTPSSLVEIIHLSTLSVKFPEESLCREVQAATIPGILFTITDR